MLYEVITVPDAGRITPWILPPDSPVVNPLTLRVHLDAGFPLESLSSRNNFV